MTAKFFAERGAKTVCLPVELPIASAVVIADAVPQIDVEIFAFGRMPLAVSGRCYHARLAGLHKDSCQFVCDRDPDGLDVSTLAGQSFLAINGIATMSHGVEAYCPPAYELQTSGIRRLRLSPQTCDMAKVAGVYRALASGAIEPNEARDRLVAIGLPGPLVDGYARGLAGATLAQSA
jgi:collagenase-like PrtC family protease